MFSTISSLTGWFTSKPTEAANEAPINRSENAQPATTHAAIQAVLGAPHNNNDDEDDIGSWLDIDRGHVHLSNMTNMPEAEEYMADMEEVDEEIIPLPIAYGSMLNKKFIYDATKPLGTSAHDVFIATLKENDNKNTTEEIYFI